MSDDFICAAQYVRMSTEHQQYSTENQSDVLREYASRRGLQIVRTFSDAKKSGLRIDGRDGLKELIQVVQTGQADFAMILVYDVSRWGRFQDADESAYYEYICKRAGITVQYCAEQFENDGSPVSTIVKGVKRAMAGEYSRELSAKVFKGQCRLIELGFRQGGAAMGCGGCSSTRPENPRPSYNQESRKVSKPTEWCWCLDLPKSALWSAESSSGLAWAEVGDFSSGSGEV
jgi:DNA invertase Pin-like site-specific DNA recombinase|nr:recombinase family protein [Geothrix sp.]